MAFKRAHRFYELTNSTHQVMINFQFMHNQCLKLGRVECAVLRYLISQGKPTSMVEIASSLDVSGSRVTHLIDNLIKKGYVRRVELPGNRRMIYAEITAEGIDIAKKYNARNIKLFNDFLKTIPLEDIEPIYAALDYWCSCLMKVNNRLKNKKGTVHSPTKKDLGETDDFE